MVFSRQGKQKMIVIWFMLNKWENKQFDHQIP